MAGVAVLPRPANATPLREDQAQATGSGAPTLDPENHCAPAPISSAVVSRRLGLAAPSNPERPVEPDAPVKRNATSICTGSDSLRGRRGSFPKTAKAAKCCVSGLSTASRLTCRSASSPAWISCRSQRSSLMFAHDLRANAFRVCCEGRPVPTLYPSAGQAFSGSCSRRADRTYTVFDFHIRLILFGDSRGSTGELYVYV